MEDNRRKSLLHRFPYSSMVSFPGAHPSPSLPRRGCTFTSDYWIHRSLSDKNLKVGGVFLSPPAQTGTYTSGLCALIEITQRQRIELYLQLSKYLFQRKKAFLIKIADWELHTEPLDFIPSSKYKHPLLEEYGIHYIPKATLFVDTGLDQQTLWKNLNSSSCRYCINKAKRNNLSVRRISRVEDIDSFVTIHRKQIEDVARRKKMSPLKYQDQHRIHELCHSLFPKHIAMLQVISPATEEKPEEILSSAIFGIGNRVSTYFTGASFRRSMHLCPNEIMVWEGMRILNQEGGRNLIFGGTAPYKKKFGTRYAYVPTMVFGRYEKLFSLWHLLKRLKSKLWRFSSKIIYR